MAFGEGGMMGMGMEGGGLAITPPDAVSGQAAVIPRLVIHDGQAGLFEKNELKRRWTMQVDGQNRYTFISADGQGGMQATTANNDPDQLSVVSVDKEGARIVRYHRTIAAVPPEWAAELAKGRAPSRSASSTRGSNDLLRGMTSGTVSPRAGAAAQGDSGRNPSDYLELLKKYQTATIEYERLLKTVGAEHPDARKLRADRDRELKAVEILRQEFQMEFDNAVRALRLKKEEAVQAEETYMYLRRQVQKGTAPQGEFEKQRLVRDAARAAVEAAETRVKLFDATTSSLFPGAEPNAEGTVPPFNPSPPLQEVPPASPQAPSPSSAPATPEPAVPLKIKQI
jgi:hypothetical protein